MAEHDNEQDKVFIDSFNETLNAMTAGMNQHAAFATLRDFLEIMRADPIPELILHAYCEAIVEKKILEIMLLSYQDDKKTINISLN